MMWGIFAQNSELFGQCGLRGGCGQIPCESSEHKSRGEFLDHLSSYKNEQKAAYGTSKEDELEEYFTLSLQTPQLYNKNAVKR
jgi:hypothetical protein